MSVFFDYLLNDIMKLDIFSNFKFRKRDSRLINSQKDHEFVVGLWHWTTPILNHMYLEPDFGVRFHVLHKWYDKFNPMKRQDMRDAPSFCLYDKELFKKDYRFEFNTAGEHYDMDFAMLALDLIEKVSYYYPRYSTLQGCYDMEIAPVMEGKKSLPSCGADWVFVDLALCKLVSPEIYPEFKKVVLKHIDWLRSRREPNIACYEGRFDEIFHYLETTDITKIK